MNRQGSMQLSLLTPLVAIALLAPASASSYIKCFVPGECRDSQILDVVEQKSSADCLHHCQTVAGCEWFSYYPDSHACAALSGCIDLNSGLCTDCVSGQKACPKYKCGVNATCFGALEGVTKVNDTEECQADCNDRLECNWHSYIPSSSSCVMTNDCPALDMSCTDCVVSERGCSNTQPNASSQGPY